MLTFYNSGTLDRRLITIMGTNVKDDPSAIGHFGTGLKYGIAQHCAHDAPLIIHDGTGVSFTFRVEPDTIRGKVFNFIRMNGSDGSSERLGFTTELGKNWQPWMVYRELFSNALDEGGGVAKGAISSTGVRIISGWHDLLGVHADRHEYFIEPGTAEVLRTSQLAIIPRSSKGLFYKGIRVHDFSPSHPSKPFATFTYNFLAGLTLTEDRSLARNWSAYACLADTILRHDDPDFIRQWVTLPTEFEAAFDLTSGAQEYNPSPAFIAAVKPLLGTNRGNSSAKKIVRRRTEGDYPPIQLTRMQQAMLDRALVFLAKMGDAPSAPIIVTDALPPNMMGTVDDGASPRIIIARATFDKGTKMLAGTIWEEHIHISKGFSDESRAFQNFLIDRLMTMHEERLGEPL